MKTIRWSVLLACCLLMRQGAWAQQKPSYAPHLSAAQIMKKTEAATGKQDDIKGIMKGTLTVGPITGTFVSYSKAPNKTLMVQTFTGVGEIMAGFDGKVRWSKDPLNGLRTISKDEMDDSDLGPDAITKNIKKDARLEMLGIRKVDGHDAYLVRATPRKPKTGGGNKMGVVKNQPISVYVDTKTFLPLRMDMVVTSTQGTFPTEMYLSDYRSFKGVKIPYVIKAKLGTVGTMDMKITDIQDKAQIDDKIFAKPPAPAPKAQKPGDAAKTGH